MKCAPLRLGHVSRGILFTAFGCSIAVGSLNRLHADSDSQRQWPRTRPLVANSNSRPSKQSEQGGDSPAQSPPTRPSSVESKDDDVSLFEDEDSAAWASFSARFATARNSLTSLRWSSLRDKIADQVLPEWTLALPDYVAKLQTEFEMGPDSLAQEIWDEAQDPDINPDIASSARVRISKDLCADETAFIRQRKKHTTKALAKYLDIPEVDINPQDVPTIAVVSFSSPLFDSSTTVAEPLER